MKGERRKKRAGERESLERGRRQGKEEGGREKERGKEGEGEKKRKKIWREHGGREREKNEEEAKEVDTYSPSETIHFD